MRTWNKPFGYEYEVVFPGIRRLFTHGGDVVLAANKGDMAYLVVDKGICADLIAPDFEETMDSMVTVLEFRDAGERMQYLDNNFVAWRNWLNASWVGAGMAMRWERWSINGEGRCCMNSP